MVLRPADFASWRINWEDKAQNIEELMRELKLSTDSIVFIDDNPAERARIRAAFPEILVPDWPADKRLYAQSLLELRCFDKPGVTEEDRRRAEMYTEERDRNKIRASATSIEDWIAGLKIEITIERLNSGNLPRIAQLLNKTNQMNLSTRRLSEAELWAWATSDAECRGCWGFRIRDCFGDSGLTGVLSLESNGGDARVIDFILSCRVMGRRIERVMLQVAVEWAVKHRLASVTARYEPTAKNMPCLAFLKDSGFHEKGDGMFTWCATEPYEASALFRVIRPASQAATQDQPGASLTGTHG
jgi:FkbH-like protein